VRKETKGIGNFWVDLTRSVVYILLPLSLALSLALVAQGTPQTFDKYATVTLVQPVTYDKPKNGPDGQARKDEKGNPVTERATATEQTIPLGPVASQIAIKQLGTNGGGYYNVNSAHPLENPTPLTNFLEVLAILLIPGALCYTFGRMIGDTRQGWALLAAMTIVLAGLLPCTYVAEQNGNPVLTTARRRPGCKCDQHPAATWKARKCASVSPIPRCGRLRQRRPSNGCVNAMHDSFTPLGGLIPLWLIQLAKSSSAASAPACTDDRFAVVAVFIAGLMIGRTPEYLGKKIGPSR
jgi:K+-transporting ATPase ATPase A chain